MERLTAVILAAGEGKRMRSRQPKVLHPLCGRALIAYPLRTARSLADRIVLVVGPNAADVVALAGPDVRAVVQAERLGSGHAVLQARPECTDGTILVLPGDMPLLSVETIERLVAHHRKSRAAATVLTAVVGEPQGYGRREEDRRDQHVGVLLRGRTPLVGARQGPLRQRPGRVLPDGRDRRAVAGRGARGRDRGVRPQRGRWRQR